jgi:serpin B
MQYLCFYCIYKVNELKFEFMKKLFLCVALLAGLCCSCQKDDGLSSSLQERKDIVLSRSEEEMVNENVKFAFSLFSKVNEMEKEKPNWMISPFSASVVLSMIANGADGNTLTELQDVLGFKGFSMDEINHYYKKLDAELKGLDNSTQLAFANSVWVNNGVNVYGSYAQISKEMYNAPVTTLDLMGPDALRTINKWCGEQTNGLIPQILDEMPRDMMACFLNALYFKGIWKNKFKESNTKNELFTCGGGSVKMVKMMRQNEDFYCWGNEYFSLAEFPYGNEAFSMVVLLPDEDKTLEECLQQFTADCWTESVRMQECNLDVRFPQFELKYDASLIEVLKAMGITEAFDEMNANFSNFSSSDMFVSLFNQSAYIKVDEKGTEAAVVTMGGGIIGAPETYTFYMNRPFAFLIKEKSTGTILFMGKVTEP